MRSRTYAAAMAGALVTALLLPLAAATCYYPDGSTANDTPCSDTDTNSACCGSGYACFGTSSQYYLCQATGEELQKSGASEFVRGSCTDSTWRSGSCPSVCVDEDRDNVSGGNGVGQCPNSTTEYYCISTGLGVDNCTTGYDIIDFASEPTAATTIGVAASSTAASSTVATASTTAVTTTAAATTTAATNSSGGLSSGAKAGVGVGVSVGALAVASIAAFLIWRRRRRHQAAAAAAAAAAAGSSTGPGSSVAYPPSGYAPAPSMAAYEGSQYGSGGGSPPPLHPYGVAVGGSPPPGGALYDAPYTRYDNKEGTIPVPPAGQPAVINELPEQGVQRHELA